MLKQLNRKNFIQIMENGLRIERFTPVCLALSGGIDSMVLAELLHQCAFQFSIAHCNFHLRGKESDEDQAFVQTWAKEREIPFYTIDFETEAYANQHSVSIEMAARDLRYNWFETLIEEHQFEAMLVAHHRDDSLETFLLNLARGTGIRGLTGIDQRNGSILRPLLDFSREQIELFAQEHDVAYREDKSNASIVYRRNKVRHDILPQLDELNPAFRSNMMRTIEHLQELQTIAFYQIEREQSAIVHQNDASNIEIDCVALLKKESASTYLFEYLKPFGFHGAVCKQMIQSMQQNESGKEFFSASHRALFNRGTLIVNTISNETVEQFRLPSPYLNSSNPIRFTSCIIEIDDCFVIERNANIAYIDMEKLDSDLTFRRWKQGDVFYPLGMKGKKKKVSDYFVDQKFSLFQKEQCWILSHNNDIVWIVGHRMDDRFKITKNTKRVVKITLTEEK